MKWGKVGSGSANQDFRPGSDCLVRANQESHSSGAKAEQLANTFSDTADTSKNFSTLRGWAGPSTPNANFNPRARFAALAIGNGATKSCSAADSCTPWILRDA